MNAEEANDNELTGAVRELAAARQRASGLTDLRNAIRLQIAMSDLGKELDEAEGRLAAAKQAEDDARQELNELAQMRYACEADKRPHPAISIRLLTMFEYDPKVAREWAEANLRAALVLDLKKFEKAIQQLGVPDFVRTWHKPQVMVSSDLTAYLS